MSNLRQAAQDVLELVEWIKDHLDVVRAGGDMGISPVLTDKLRAALAEPQTTHWEGCEAVHPECKVTPRKPLTDEEIEALWQNTSPYYDHQDFARAIERKHGIGEQT